jgi:hypothetical protein
MKFKKHKAFKRQILLKKKINNHLASVVFQGIIKNLKKINSFTGENHNIQI